MELKNAEYTAEWTVTEAMLAKNVGSGDVNAFATPMLVALMECAAATAVKPFLEAGQTTVGAFISTSHIAATPVGMKVSATARVTLAEGKKLEFIITATDERSTIGEGTHTRYILDKERFEQKAIAKL